MHLSGGKAEQEAERKASASLGSCPLGCQIARPSETCAVGRLGRLHGKKPQKLVRFEPRDANKTSSLLLSFVWGMDGSQEFETK